MLAIVGIDGKRSLKFAEALAAGSESYLEVVASRRNIKLILVVEGLLVKCLQFLFLEHQMHGVTKAGAHGTVRLAGNSEDVDVGAKLALFLFKFDGSRRDLHGQA